ncbi:RNA-binding protein MEX3B-like [Acipenser oxyrinchus oxyrinchus]|uniref:RNA-binding protein MEX3B-like n=1 Tax=Acipenser oxyrinchus oxyrinchus TaxID=40147 RepID=A0AAD8CL72_ACIOX|nr:RNA-binding protein MEX3B-like [Acipenser oxyrinchus oxyrinchus]
MPSSLYHPDIMEGELIVSTHHGGGMTTETEDGHQRDEQHQEALRFALDQLSLIGLEDRGECGGTGETDPTLVGLDDGSCNGVGVGFIGLQMMEHPGGPSSSPTSCSPPPDWVGPGFHMAAQHQHSILGEQVNVIGCRKRSVNMTECVPVPSSEHVAEIVGRQGCKIKALRAKTNTYIKTPVRGEEPMFIVTGRKEDVEMAKREILSAAEHFSMIRASRNKASAAGLVGAPVPGPPNLPGQTTIQVRVPYRVVGLVVGPKGATIKRIQQQTHTYIVTPSRDKDPVFEVTGMPENVDRAREEIETHITLRTGAFVDLQGDNDFHSNGTDVSLDASGLVVGAGLWARPTNSAHGAAASAARKIATAAFRNGSLSSLGSGSTESHYSSAGGRIADTSPTSPFSTGSAGGGGAGGTFAFGGEPHAALPPADDLGFEFTTGAGNIWAPFVNGLSQTACQQQQQRRNSGLSAGALTPRLSPTLPESVVLDHPLARRAQSDPLSALSWLHGSGSAASSFSGSTTGYSSASASSLPGSLSSAASGGSPTDSEGGMLGRLKSARECSVCFESEVTAALVPCGHNLFCMECAAQICKSAEPECPVCHTPATQAIRILL